MLENYWNRVNSLMKEKSLTRKSLSAKCGFTERRIESLSMNNRSPDVDESVKIANVLGTTVEFLATGEDAILYKESDVAKIENGIPYYDIDVMAHISEVLDLKDERVSAVMAVPGLRNAFACFPVYGDSMAPKIVNGDVIVVGKPTTDFETVLWGEIYLVVTDTMRTIKTVHPSEKSDIIILRSINPEFTGDTPVAKSTLRALYLVKGTLSRFNM